MRRVKVAEGGARGAGRRRAMLLREGLGSASEGRRRVRGRPFGPSCYSRYEIETSCGFVKRAPQLLREQNHVAVSDTEGGRVGS